MSKPASEAFGYPVEGFGASYQRGPDHWALYTMPDAKPFGTIAGYDPARLNWVVDALRAHALGGPWRCFHCGDLFTDPHRARDHFGATEDQRPACQIKAAEGGLLAALRGAEAEAMAAWEAVHAESADALKAWRNAQSRHRRAESSAEEAGYERGLADGRKEQG